MKDVIKYEREMPRFDIVDSQIHIGPGGIQETLASMDALGIQSVLVDEFWISYIPSMRFEPVQRLESGCVRPLCPTVQLAARWYPDRFGYMLRVAFNDPEAESIVRIYAADPGCKAFRIEPGMSPLTVEAFAKGAYDLVMQSVADSGKTLFIYLPDHPELIAEAASKFKDLRIVVDHCGMYSNSNRKTFHSPYQDLSLEESEDLYDKVLTLSKYPNVCMKWSHASENLGLPIFPGTKLRRFLRKAIDAFGADRIIWASDFSVNQVGETWGELLFGFLINDNLSDEEKEKILGLNVRRLLGWEAVNKTKA